MSTVIADLNIISTNITVVFEPFPVQAELADKVRSLLSPPVTGGIATGPGQEGFVFMSVRDQLTVVLTSRALLVKDDSGQKPGVKPVTKLTYEMIGTSKPKIKAFGFNYEVEFSLQPRAIAGDYISKQLLRSDSIERKLGSKLEGGAAVLRYRKDAKLHTLRIEPRLQEYGGSKVLASLNAHEDASVLPSEATLADSFSAIYQGFVRDIGLLFRIKKATLKR